MVHSEQTFDTVLGKIRKESRNTVELGTRFERLVFDFLKTDSVYSKRFEKVWMWKDWARENKIKDKMGVSHDLGVDIVAKERGGTLCAIQCKCYDDNALLDKDGINSFIAAGRSYKMDSYVLACTSQINDNALAILRGVRCNIITQEHFRDSGVDWSQYPKIKAKKPKTLRDYQQTAMDDVLQGFKKNSRGKMIMACGTGKTLVSMRIAEKLAGKGGTVLYLVPSISLILQSMREWSDNSTIPHYYMAVCSDKSVRNSEDGTLTELETPASTDPKELSERLSKMTSDTMNVIFSTYHSIEVVMRSVDDTFDLILCDEAHRTAGIGSNSKESFLTMVHHECNIKAKRRLYMTATPRIYTDSIKNKAQQKEKEIISMDDESVYGEVFHNLSFHDAVHKYNALSDFKVRVAIMDGDTMDSMIQKSVANDEHQIPLNEKTLMASVWHALQYPDIGDEKELLQRIIVFCDMINSSKLFAGEELSYKKDVREQREAFEKVKEIDANRSFERLVGHIKKVVGDDDPTAVQVRHVDGGDNAQSRRRELDWLRDSEDDPNTCRMVSNARCLSEGVDVPALDGVVFMNPRKSVVDVVQAVGRVMRKSPGKDFGYVVLPVAIPAGMRIEDALSDNKHFKVVWQVLNALRSHDSNLAEEINRLILDPPTGKDNEITNRIIIRHANSHNLAHLDMPADKMIRGITTKLIEKVGDVDYYDKYGKKIGSVSRTIETRIKNKVEASSQIKTDVTKFHGSLKKMINDSITYEATIRVISQHMVLSQVFDALFQDEFTSHNPISVEFEKIVKKIDLREELKELEGFYTDVKAELEDIRTKEARQNFIKKIYGNFFESADKKGAEKHGIVYTPIEVIDFIINSTQYLLGKHFGIGFTDRSVKVLEPFAGTGTFITRLLESGLIDDNMYEKYKNDLFANEIILLAYYVATVNIETTYSNLRRGRRYVPFEGISYTDTLEINARYREGSEYRRETSRIDQTFKAAHERLRQQRGTHLHVLMGNPPYSAKQSSFHDESPNMSYDDLDTRIDNTYLKRVKHLNKNIHLTTALHDSYIRSLRWASDRIGESGIIAFITNASFIRTEIAAGIRESFAEEFNEIWCFDLRGNARTVGEARKKEGGNVFGSGSRAPVAITILVKNPRKKDHTIRYKDIGDYLTREEKLDVIKNIKSIQGIKNWQIIQPDSHHDWLNPRSDEFSKYTPIGSKEVKSGKNTNAVFKTYSGGVKTNRDVWTYNSSKDELGKNMRCHIDYCNAQDLDKPKFDPKRAKWTEELTDRLKRAKAKPKFENNKIRNALYRPFFKQSLYFEEIFINSIYKIPEFFPENYSKNLTVCIPYKFIGEFSIFVTDLISDVNMITPAQCFPLYIYEKNQDKKSNITDHILNEYQSHYKDKNITKKSIFYYVYALLHHKQYKEKFANNLSRELPHIPMAPDFWIFSKIGEKLVDLHLNFDKCKRYNLGTPKVKFTKFTKIGFPKKKIEKDGKTKQVNDKTRLRIDGIEVFDNIPEINYQVNGRTPLEWIIDRYKITTDEESGITNDPCTGTDIISVIERAIFVGTESDRIIKELPIEFEPKDWEPKKTGLDAYSETDGKRYQSKL